MDGCMAMPEKPGKYNKKMECGIMDKKLGELIFLSQEDVISLGALDMHTVVPLMEEVYRTHYRKETVLPGKCVLRWGDDASEWTRGRINAMPGAIGGEINAVGIKWIASNPQNPFKRQLPRASALIILNDPESLIPIAVMDGTVISAARTGANTGVAAKYLARKNSKVLGLIGAGVQNRTQMMAVLSVLPGLQEIRVFDINKARAMDFATEMAGQAGQPIHVMDTARETVAGADVFITATATKDPIIEADWIEPGVLYSHVGSHECTFEAILKMDRRIVDDWEQIKHRGVESLAIMHKNGMITDDAISGEIGAIVDGAVPARTSDAERIYFNTVGLGIQDVALASLIYNRALKKDIGVPLKLWDKPFAL